jgi:pimeloyl-ACP methyl ester carboxylesterase
MTPNTITFDSAGTACEAWHLPAAHDGLATSAGRPVVVLAHGLGGTKDSGLLPFAEAFAAAGLDAFLFDYRGFGGSDGTPRQVVSLSAQLDDWQAAMRAAAALPGVDPHRLVLWGVSLAGGHVLAAAAGRDDVAAVVSVVPLVDGLAAGRHAFASHSAVEIGRSTLLGLRSRLGRTTGRAPRMMPLVAHPGEVGALTLPGAYEDYLSIAGPTWRNEIAADVSLELGSRQPLRRAADVRCPVLVQIADFDRSAPPHAAAKAAFRARAEVRHYPGDHFDLFPGKSWHEPAVRHATAFLVRHVSPAVEARSAAEPRDPVSTIPTSGGAHARA